MKTKLGDIKSIEDLFKDKIQVGSYPSAGALSPEINIYTWKCRICGDTVRGTDYREAFTEHLEFHQLLNRLNLIEHE